MYGSTFSTDWTRLRREEAIERAFALGVAAACGEGDDEEYDRLVEASPGGYDRSIIELAFEEGRTRALKLVSSGSDPENVWEELVETDSSETDTPLSQRLPGALGKVGVLDRDRFEGPPRSLDRPEFLERR